MRLDASQEAAVRLMVEAPFAVVTGGAGVGKTTCLRAALDELDARHARYVLAAPTGKAARRMTEATGRDASTIHRLLGYGQGSHRGFFGYGKGCPLDAGAVFIDEASMIDVELAAALFEAIAPGARIILIGDANQLPSVGPGSVFGDLMRSRACPVARLTKLHRAAADSWICTQGPRILAGKIPDLEPRDDFRWIEREKRDDAVDALVELIAGAGGHDHKHPRQPALISSELGVEDPDAVQVLVPQTVGPAGAIVLNTRLQRILNPVALDERAGWKLGGKAAGYRVCEGDRVIQTRNDYQLDVMNGEIGRVTLARGEGMALGVDFGGKRVSYTRKTARPLQLAYALTIHKYQGSEIPWAVVFCHSTHTQMLGRTLLYTAVTRAKQGVVIVGDRVGLERAVRNASTSRRNTDLSARLRAELEAAA